MHWRRGGTANAGGPAIKYDNRREHSPWRFHRWQVLNPGAPELNTVAKQLSISPTEVVPAVIPLVLPHLALATAIFWVMRLRAKRKAGPAATATEMTGQVFRVNYLRALVPLLPLVLLFLAGPPLNVVKVPERWVVTKPLEALAQVAGGSAMLFDRKDPHFDTRLIGLAMLIGVLAAATTNPRAVRGVPKAFFEGAGYAFAEVISLIVIASCFGKAIEIVGFGDSSAMEFSRCRACCCLWRVLCPWPLAL